MSLTALLVGAALAASGGDRPADALERYRQALLAKDGEAAARAVDSASLAYYARMRDLALDGAPAAVKALPVLDRLTVIRLRHEVGRAQLEPLDGAKTIALAVDRGWVSPESVQQVSIGKVRVSGDSATAELKVGSQVAPPEYSWRFRREGGTWKLSLLSLMKLAEPAVREVVRQSGVSEDQFIVATVEKLSGKAVPETIWLPLRAAKP